MPIQNRVDSPMYGRSPEPFFSNALAEKRHDTAQYELIIIFMCKLFVVTPKVHNK